MLAAAVKSVLIVDDTTDTVDLLAYCVQLRGCNPVRAYNGLEAVEQAERYKPDLIFMDIRMPIMDGYEATQQILSKPELASTPIVAMSAHCDGEWRERAIAAGCKDCIPKPMLADEFCDVLQQYIDGCRGDETSQTSL